MKDSMNPHKQHYLFSLTAILVISLLTGCSEVEHSSGKVLENANSVIRSGGGKVWTNDGGKVWNNEDASGRAQYEDGKRYDPHRGYVDDDEPVEKEKDSPYIAAPDTAIGDDKY